MRRGVLLAGLFVGLLLTGCLPSGGIRRKPGSDVVLPAAGNLFDAIVVTALCLGVPTPGVVTTIGITTPTATPALTPGTVTGPATASQVGASPCSWAPHRDPVPASTIHPPLF